MLDGGVSRRYARALFDVAEGAGTVDEVEEEFKAVTSLIDGDGEVKHFWTSRAVQAEAKKATIEASFGGHGIGRPVLNFLKVVVDKGRESSLPGMLTEYSRLADDHRRVVDVEVRSATELGSATCERIGKGVEASLGKKVRLRVMVEPELIGGIVVRIGDRVMDGSVAGRLTALKRTMVSNL